MAKREQVVNVGTPNVNSNTREQQDPSTYVVVRDGHRVNDDEYTSATDPIALSWVAHYNRITNVWPDGTKTEVVKYNLHIHRTWNE